MCVATVLQVNDDQPGRRPSAALGTAGLLLLGALLVCCGGIVGTAHTFDGSAPGHATGAVWVVVIPVVVAVLAAGRRPVQGLAVVAGAGLMDLTRLLSDLSLVSSPNSAVRPEFFYELSARAQPFSAASGAVFVLVGDAVMVVAGVLAARALTDRLASRAAPIFDLAPDGGAFAGRSPRPPEQGPELLAEAIGSAVGLRTDGTAEASTAAGGSDDGNGLPGRNNHLVAAGFLGVLLLLGASLALPYTGGYLASRYLPAELGLPGIAAALAAALLGAVAVLVAAALPRLLGLALLGGAAAAAAVPFLTALAVRAAGAPVQLTLSVGVGLAGVGVLAGAGLLGRSRRLVPDERPDVTPARANTAGAVLALLTAAGATGAWRLPQLHYNGGADPVPAGGFAISAPLAAPFLVAAIIPLVAAVLWCVPALAGAGRAVATLAWLPLVFAVTRTLTLLDQVVSSASVPNAGFAPPTWTAGPGLWCAVAGIVTGLLAAGLSLAAARQAREASLVIQDDESLARSRSFGTVVAAGLTVAVVVVGLLPAYATAAGASATLLVGFRLDSWGVLVLSLGMAGAAFAGGRARQLSAAIAFPLVAAAISIVQLVVPAAVRAADGFSLRSGWYAGWVLVALFGCAAVALGRSAKGIELAKTPVAPPARGRPARVSTGTSGGRGRSRQGPEKQPPPAKPKGKRPVEPTGKRPAAGASSSKAAKGRS